MPQHKLAKAFTSHAFHNIAHKQSRLSPNFGLAFSSCIPLNALTSPTSSSSSSSSSTSSSTSTSNSRSSSVSMPRITIQKEMFSTVTNNNNDNHVDNNKNNNNDDKNTTPPPLLLQPLIICGPSGVGKGTIIQKYMDDHEGSSKFGFTVSHTTRKPRPGEVDGVHYHYTSVSAIQESISNHDFLEWAEVHGNYYGTSLQSLTHVQNVDEKIPLLDIDVQGVKNVKAWMEDQQDMTSTTSSTTTSTTTSMPKLDAKFVFIAPPSLDTLKRRLISRGTETPESIERRTNNAGKEMEYGLQDGNFDAIVVNDDLDDACVQLGRIIDELYNN